MLTSAVLKHMKRPHGMGVPARESVVGLCGDPHQGPFMRLFLEVAEGRIVVALFQTYSCPWAIACGSALTLLLEGKLLKEAAVLQGADIEAELEGVAREKQYAVHLAMGSLQDALRNGSKNDTVKDS